MTNKPLSLYFHFPFCVKKCAYCAFYSLQAQPEEIKNAYCGALEKQIGFLPREREIISVYFGGGTPSSLGAERLCKLIEKIKERCSLAPDCEITVEVNPGTAGESDFYALYAAGFNRISAGVQSANDETLAFLGRIHDFRQARECILAAKRAGFANIGADLIFALPGQSAEDFLHSIDSVCDLGVQHISAYSLQLEPGTPLYAKRGTLCFPDEEAEEAVYGALCARLKERGYEHYEISSFALPGFRARHNGVYWNRGEYLGIGAGAHSFYGGKRFSAPCDINAFIQKAGDSLFAPTDRETAPLITVAEAEEERVMLGLRTSDGAVVPPGARVKARRIAEAGFGVFDGERLVLNEKGFRVSNEIIAEVLI